MNKFKKGQVVAVVVADSCSSSFSGLCSKLGVIIDVFIEPYGEFNKVYYDVKFLEPLHIWRMAESDLFLAGEMEQILYG